MPDPATADQGEACLAPTTALPDQGKACLAPTTAPLMPSSYLIAPNIISFALALTPGYPCRN